MIYVVGLLVVLMIVLYVKSILQQYAEKPASQVLDADVAKKKKQSEQKTKEYKDAKDSFSSRYSEYLESKRTGKPDNDGT